MLLGVVVSIVRNIALLVFGLFCLQIHDRMQVSGGDEWMIYAVALLVAIGAAAGLGALRRNMFCHAGESSEPLSSKRTALRRAVQTDLVLSPMIAAVLYTLHPHMAWIAVGLAGLGVAVWFLTRQVQGRSHERDPNPNHWASITLGVLGAWLAWLYGTRLVLNAEMTESGALVASALMFLVARIFADAVLVRSERALQELRPHQT